MNTYLETVTSDDRWCWYCEQKFRTGTETVRERDVGGSFKTYHKECWIRAHKTLMEALVPVWVELKANKSLDFPPSVSEGTS